MKWKNCDDWVRTQKRARSSGASFPPRTPLLTHLLHVLLVELVLGNGSQVPEGLVPFHLDVFPKVVVRTVVALYQALLSVQLDPLDESPLLLLLDEARHLPRGHPRHLVGEVDLRFVVGAFFWALVPAHSS
jgi:hypothetical protein